jgi:hypothetical protein
MQIYGRALVECKKALRPDYALTLNAVYNLGNLYRRQSRLDEAEQIM